MQSEPEPNNEVEMVKNQEKHSESVCEEFRSETIKTDEETELISSSGIEDDDETNTDKSEMKPSQQKQAEPKAYIQKDSAYFQHLISSNNVDLNDGGIDLEFEHYLNEENDLDKLVSEDSENFETFKSEISSKIRRLEKVNFDSLSDLRRMAIGKYGLVNKRFRRKAWPILISNRVDLLHNASTKKKNTNKKMKAGHLKEDIEDELNFNHISNIFFFLFYSKWTRSLLFN